MHDLLPVTFELPPQLELRMASAPEALAAELAQVVVVGGGGESSFVRQSAGALSALRIVWEDESGVVRTLDYADADHIDLIAGLTLTATATAGGVRVQREGVVDDTAWSWAPGPVYLGADGALTQTPPADGFDVRIGSAVSQTRLYLEIEEPIQLED